MATTTNFGWETPDDTDLVKDGALAMRTLGNSIDTSFVDLKGGTTGQVLSKASNTDLDFTWVAQDDSNAIQNAIIDAKGDLIVGTAADTPARLPIGTNGYILTADSAEASGMKWAAAAGGGKVLQVVQQFYSTQTDSSSSTFADTGITLNITPSSTSSKVLAIVSINGCLKTEGNTSNSLSLRLMRGATQLMESEDNGFTNSALYLYMGTLGMVYLDSPSTTSATTYKVQFRNPIGAALVRINASSSESTITLMEIGA